MLLPSNDVTWRAETDARLRVGWWYGTPRYKPFFDASVLTAEPAS